MFKDIVQAEATEDMMNLIASAEKSWKTSWTARVLHRPA